MVPIEQKDWTEEDRASKLGQNHPLDSTKSKIYISIYMISLQNFLPKLLRQEMGENGKKSPFFPS
ncbi:MAG: hypothetical protein WCF56_03260, partial [Pseudolabrys sp.]